MHVRNIIKKNGSFLKYLNYLRWQLHTCVMYGNVKLNSLIRTTCQCSHAQNSRKHRQISLSGETRNGRFNSVYRLELLYKQQIFFWRGGGNQQDLHNASDRILQVIKRNVVPVSLIIISELMTPLEEGKQLKMLFLPMK